MPPMLLLRLVIESTAVIPDQYDSLDDPLHASTQIFHVIGAMLTHVQSGPVTYIHISSILFIPLEIKTHGSESRGQVKYNA